MVVSHRRVRQLGERVRMLAAGAFARGEGNTVIAEDLRSVCGQWSGGAGPGGSARGGGLASVGPGEGAEGG